MEWVVQLHRGSWIARALVHSGSCRRPTSVAQLSPCPSSYDYEQWLRLNNKFQFFLRMAITTPASSSGNIHIPCRFNHSFRVKLIT